MGLEPPAESRPLVSPQALPSVLASWGATWKRLAGVQVLEGVVCATGCRVGSSLGAVQSY